jgi:hypothetical protein
MNRTEALQKIETYLDGTLVGKDLVQFEEMVCRDATVYSALQHAKELDHLLANQLWLTPSDGFTQSVIAEVGLKPSLERAKVLDGLLAGQIWLSPSAQFTQLVMAKIGLSPAAEEQTVPVSRRELISDWIQGLAPAAAVIAFVIMFGKGLWESLLGYLHTSGAVLDSVVGTRIFEQQPLIQLGIIVPLLGSAIISAMVTRRLRLAS